MSQNPKEHPDSKTSVVLVPLPTRNPQETAQQLAEHVSPAWQRLYDLIRDHQIELTDHADNLSPTVAQFLEESLQPLNPNFPVHRFALALAPTATEPARFSALPAQSIVGAAHAILPQNENTYTAHIDLFVAPAFRRRGIGSSALAQLLEFLRENNRTQAETWPTTSSNSDGERLSPRLGVGSLPAADPTVRFLSRNNFGLELIEKVCELHLEHFASRLSSGTLTVPQLDSDLDIQHYGNELANSITPEFIAAINAFNAEHPQSDSATPFTTSAQEYAQAMRNSIDRGNQHCGVMIRERKSGRVVAITEAHYRGSVAAQSDTWVHADYRGRGLATLAKIELYRMLVARAPSVVKVSTENAESNVGMWKVNERLGFKVVAAQSHWVSVFGDAGWASYGAG
ncbi:GNAT superfamily N-acetyltransferase [Trueperella bonasi]|uniref:GNAT superfamily N-acetyltransferase n=1 Tax=Trueperella bonasi TaxID=312286 RepID=A0ABT9NG41_9ACTO|nr:GNAT family N-acetyltransferase [Trueperella bonasi]MDP9805803.1 GNAT superfamily N-acetyltransferase [Trueperella bonasi]